MEGRTRSSCEEQKTQIKKINTPYRNIYIRKCRPQCIGPRITFSECHVLWDEPIGHQLINALLIGFDTTNHLGCRMLLPLLVTLLGPT